VSSVPLTMDPWFVDAVARRVAEILDSGASLTVAEVAARYGVSRSWVYAHQRELGALRLGAGPRARLRFDPKVVADAIAAFEGAREAEQAVPDQGRRGREVPLIPFEPMG
jgi:transposase-like protein